jgi:cytochrome P450
VDVSEQETLRCSHLTVIADDWTTSVWGADAPQIWRQMVDSVPVMYPVENLAVATSTEAIRAALRNPAVFSSNPDAGYFGSETGAIPVQIDPPEHSRFRKMLDPLFAPRTMAARANEVERAVNDCIDTFIDRGSVEFCSEFAVPFPCETFLRVMGLPLEQLDDFLRVKQDMIRPAGTSPAERHAVQERAAAWTFDYFSRALADRQNNLGDDVISALVQLEADGRLTRDETLNICLLFIPAGLDTVTDTLECSFAFLAGHPQHQTQLADDLDLCSPAVEELLRHESPVPIVNRVAMSDTTLEGCPVSKGQRIDVLLAAANHDPRVFGDPEHVDFLRQVNPHVAFGGGIHRCVGSNLARLELRIAFREWHRRIPNYWLRDGEQIEYGRGMREIESMNLEFPPGGGRRPDTGSTGTG